MSDKLPTQFLQKTLEDVLLQLELDPQSPYEVRSDVPRLWASRVFRVTVFPERRDPLHLFIKCLPTDHTTVKALNIRALFDNESAFYNIIITAFTQLGPYVGVPRCYTALCSDEDCVLVLEDLLALGFKSPNRLRDLSVRELCAILQEVGRLHGFSLALREKRPAVLEQLKKTVRKEVYNELFRDLLKFANQNALKLVQASYPVDSTYVTKYSRFVQEGAISFVERAIHTDVNDEQYGVISHSDLWASNVMLHSELDQAKLIDFQTCRYASAGLDLAYVFYTATDKKVRDTHGVEMLNAYKDTLNDTLRDLGCDSENALTQKMLESILLPKGALYALGVGVQNIVFTLDDGENSEDNLHLDGDALDTLKAPFRRQTQRCQQRLLNLITDVIDQGYLDDTQNE